MEKRWPGLGRGSPQFFSVAGLLLIVSVSKHTGRRNNNLLQRSAHTMRSQSLKLSAGGRMRGPPRRRGVFRASARRLLGFEGQLVEMGPQSESSQGRRFLGLPGASDALALNIQNLRCHASGVCTGLSGSAGKPNIGRQPGKSGAALGAAARTAGSDCGWGGCRPVLPLKVKASACRCTFQCNHTFARLVVSCLSTCD